MNRAVLVLRPEPGAGATAARARAAGLEPILAPLFAVRAIAWTPPAGPPPALLVTSANAMRHGGAALAAMRAARVYAVGAATAAAASDAGFDDVVVGAGDAAAIVALAAARGERRLLHLAGREHRAPPAGDIVIERRIVYAADAVTRLPDAAAAALGEAVALLHSPRAGALFANLVPARATVAVAAISPAALAAAGGGWRVARAARAPIDAALLAVARELCDHRSPWTPMP